jgi:hypothetical protein
MVNGVLEASSYRLVMFHCIYGLIEVATFFREKKSSHKFPSFVFVSANFVLFFFFFQFGLFFLLKINLHAQQKEISAKLFFGSPQNS